ncbi:hypothetical protein JTE90_001216 [Oedothorax gibbosus]|uniref:MutS-like protein n=1 Tax=Oedothorax gibbosus TaxID=931172 RepID=A0AAV6UU43_9ARAC|nr:hypothetical protein JTE90_001216 [Oedothorax gibbosus]
MERNRSKSEFVQRIVNIPVVYLAWNLAADTYSTIKSSNNFLRVSLSTTEKAAYFVSQPILKTFENQLKSADLIACRGLETLQGIVPSISNQRRKFYKQTRIVYEDTVESGLKKYELVKKLGASKVMDFINDGTIKLYEFLATPYGEVCEIGLDFALEAGELYVDQYLPPLGDERPEKLFGDRGKAPVSKRAELLRNRFKERFYKHSLLKVQMIRLRTRFLLIKVYHINLYNYLVETSALVPGLLLNTVIRVFSNLQDLISYILELFNASQNQRIAVT